MDWLEKLCRLLQDIQEVSQKSGEAIATPAAPLPTPLIIVRIYAVRIDC